MDMYCEKGEQILLTDSCSQTFKGVVKSVNLNLGRIVLADVVQFPGNKSIIGYRNFDRNEIREIKKCGVEKEEIADSFEDDMQKTEEQQHVDKPVMLWSESKYSDLKKLQREYRYIKDFGPNFHHSISLLKTCSMIGVYGMDSSKGRLARISVIAISTLSNIFVYDLQVLGNGVLEKELKEILESPNVIKVTYDCRLLSDCLKHKHLVNLENVRDVEAEDVMVVYQERRIIRSHTRPLEHLSNVYLGLELESCSSCEAWNERPLPKNLIEVLVSHVSVLIPLQEEIERKYLQKLIDASNIYNCHLRNADYFDFLFKESGKTLRSQIGKLLVPKIQARTNCKRNKPGREIK